MTWIFVGLTVCGITTVALLAKLAGRKGADPLAFSLSLFGVSILISLIPFFLPGKPDGGSPGSLSLTAFLVAALAGLGGGAAVLLFNTAIRSGPFGFSNAIYRSSFVIPVVFSVLFLSERITPPVFTGILAVLSGIILMSWSADSFDRNKPAAFRWFLLILLSFFLSGAPRLGQTLTSRLRHDYFTYLLLSYLAGFAVLLLPAFLRKTRFGRNAFLFGGGAAAASYLAVFSTLKALETLPRSVVFPVTLSGPVVLGTLLSLLVFREKIRPAGWAGIISTLLGIFILTLWK